jgi:hypothetical protein
MTTENELTKPMLETLAAAPEGALTTTALRLAIKQKIQMDEGDLVPLQGRPDFSIDQKIRNLKSHRLVPGNPLFEGLVEDTYRGFKITSRGRAAIRHR